MSFSSIPSFKSGTASPSKLSVPITVQSALSPSSLSNRSASPSPQLQSSGNFIPWTSNQGKLYRSIGEEAWKKCEKTVRTAVSWSHIHFKFTLN